MGQMRIMGRKGDTKTIWNPENKDEVKSARKTFDELRAKGFSAYRVDEEGDKGGRMDSFDPQAGKVIMVPRMGGGI